MRHPLNNKIIRSLLVTIVAFGLLGVAAGATAADPFAKAKLTERELIDGSKKEKAFVFYCAFDTATIKMELKHFKAKYPWVNTSFVRAGGLVIGQKFYAEKARGIEKVDAICSGAAELYPDFRNRGYLAKIDNLPEYAAVRAVTADPKGYYVSPFIISHPMFWNTKRVKAEEVPDDLWEFTKPKWKNRTASGNPALAGFALNWFSWVCECRKQHPAGKRSSSGLGVKWMNAMRENGILMPGQIGPLTQSIASGQRDISVHQFTSEIVRSIAEGAPLDYKYPKQGTIGQHVPVAVNAKAPHPYTARLFVNWLLSKEAQILHIQKRGMHSSRKDLDTQKHFPLKKGTVSFDQLWLLDLESVTPEETKKFIKMATEALAGKKVK